MIGTENGVATVRVFSANPKTADGYNTFIFRRSVEKSLRKLSWLPVIDGRGNPLPEGIRMGDKTIVYTEEERAAIRRFVVDVATCQKGPLFNDDFGKISIGRDFVKEIQQHCISTRRDVAAVSSAREIATKMVHFTASPNQELERRNGVLYFEYGLARLRLDDGLYLAMGEVGVRRNSQPYYDQRIVAKFKADSEAPSLHGHLRIGESAFDAVYDSRFRLILQGVEQYFLQTEKSEKSKRKIPFFSVVIPVYNGAPYLRECLDSVVAQTFANWEAICIDDGSTDGSGAILDEYAAKDKRIMVIHAENRGVSAARNAGIDIASGKYVTFLDGDDVYEPFWLETFHRLIEETGAELVRLRFKFWDGGAHETVSVVGRPKRVCFAGEEVVDWGCSTYSLEGWSWLNAIKRSCLNGTEHVRFPVGMKFMEDIVFMMQVVFHVHSACQGEVAGYLYRQHAASVCGGTRNVSEVVRFFEEAARLPGSISAEKQKCLSWMLGLSVLHWRGRRDKGEVGGGAAVRECVVKAVKDSMFSMSELPARWRPGFAAMVYLHSFLVMDLLLLLQRAWGRIRRLCVGMGFGKQRKTTFLGCAG